MKTNIVLFVIVAIGIMLILLGAFVWYVSTTAEFSRVEPQTAPAEPSR